jgi:hypothetical protein
MDQGGIVRGDHHGGEQSDVVGKPGVQFVVALELFLRASFQTAAHPFLGSQALKITLHQHERLSVGNILTVDGVEIALAKAQVMHGVQDVCLPAPVVSKEAIHLIPKHQVRTSVVFEIDQMKFLQTHGANFLFLGSITQLRWLRKQTKTKPCSTWRSFTANLKNSSTTTKSN